MVISIAGEKPAEDKIVPEVLILLTQENRFIAVINPISEAEDTIKIKAAINMAIGGVDLPISQESGTQGFYVSDNGEEKYFHVIREICK